MSCRHRPMLASGAAHIVTTLTGDEDYATLLESTRSSGRAAVVEFTSEDCAACKAASPCFAQMASAYPEIEWCVQIFQTCSKAHFKACGVQGVPHVHVLVRGEAIESFSCPPTKLRRIIGKLMEHKLVAPCRWYRGWFGGRRWRRWLASHG